METAISFGVICFTLVIIIYVEKIMHRKAPTEKEISDYQEVLDTMDANAKTNYGLVWKHDALTELMAERKMKKSFTLIFSGIFLALSLILLGCFTTWLSFSNIGTACIGGIVLICYGLIKIAESKKLAIVILSSIFIIGTLMMFTFDKLMLLSPYAYFYLCALIVVLGIFTLVPKLKENKKKIGLFLVIFIFTTQTWAQKSDSKEFKQLYKQTVVKLSSERKDTIEFRVFRMNDFSVTSIVYKEKNDCLCSDKLCHGPRLILSANFGKTEIFVFPNGYCFVETNHFSPGIDIVAVDVEKEKIAEARFKTEAEETLLNYLSFY